MGEEGAGRAAACPHRRPLQSDRRAAGPAAGDCRHHHVLARARQLVQPADRLDRAQLAGRGARLSRRARTGDPHRHRQHGQGPRRGGVDRRARSAQVPRADVRAGRPARPAGGVRGRWQGRGESRGGRGREDPLHRAARAPAARRRRGTGAPAHASRHVPCRRHHQAAQLSRTPTSTSRAESIRRSCGTCARPRPACSATRVSGRCAAASSSRTA